MQFKNKIIVAFIFITLFYTNLFGMENEACEEVFEQYLIREELKSYKGWMRVCNNNKLRLYTNVPFNNTDKKMICSCFTKDKEDRAVNYFKIKEKK